MAPRTPSEFDNDRNPGSGLSIKIDRIGLQAKKPLQINFVRYPPYPTKGATNCQGQERRERVDNVQEKYIDEAQARENMSASYSVIFKVLEMWKIKPELTGATDILEVHGVCRMNCKCRTAGDCACQIECKCETELSLETKARYESEISMIEGAAGKYKTKNPCTYKLPNKLRYKDRPGITEIDRPHATKVKAELECHLTDHKSPRPLDSGILADECQFGFERVLRMLGTNT